MIAFSFDAKETILSSSSSSGGAEASTSCMWEKHGSDEKDGRGSNMGSLLLSSYIDGGGFTIVVVA
jgi:hypothetical protein